MIFITVASASLATHMHDIWYLPTVNVIAIAIFYMIIVCACSQGVIAFSIQLIRYMISIDFLKMAAVVDRVG